MLTASSAVGVPPAATVDGNLMSVGAGGADDAGAVLLGVLDRRSWRSTNVGLVITILTPDDGDDDRCGFARYL